VNQLLGVLLIINGIVVTAWWVATGKGSATGALAVCGLAVFAGIALVLSDRLVEVSVKGVGTIKAAADQAISDAKEIATLRQRIEAQGATVDLVAKEAADAKALVDEVARKNQQAEQKLSSLDQAIREGNEAVAELEAYTQFNSTILAAQNDDRKAYDQLWEWANTTDHTFQKAAGKAVQTIMDQHDPAMVRSGFTIPWKEGVDPQKLAVAEIEQTFKQAPPHIRVGLLEFLWEKRTDIPKKDRLAFLVEVLPDRRESECGRVRGSLVREWDWRQTEATCDPASPGMVGEEQGLHQGRAVTGSSNPRLQRTALRAAAEPPGR
jgi:hypothetical protein